MTVIQPLYLAIERSDEFLGNLEYFIQDLKRAPGYVALNVNTRYNTHQKAIYFVSARFVVPAKQTSAGDDVHIDPPVVACYDQYGLPDGHEYSKKIRDTLREWKIRMVAGVLVGAEPPAAIAHRAPAEPAEAPAPAAA